TYTLKPANAAGRPPLHDAWQLDCLPSGLSFAAYGTTPGGVTTSTPVTGTGGNGCPANYTVLAWNLGDLAGGTTLTLTYTATVDPGASGKSSFTNVASVSGNSLAGTRTSPTDPGNPNGRQYSAAANSTVNVAGATALKSVTPTAATVGDTVTYSTSAVLPAGVTFYNLSLIDQLPNGIDPTSVVQGSVSCTNADTSACGLTSATPLTPVAGSGSSTIIGWLIGDASTSTQVRTVTVKYTAKIKDTAAAIAGAGLVNQLHAAWNTSAGTPPTSAGASFNQSSPIVTATVTVLEPSLSITKAVTKLHPEPGQSFTYTVTVSNANAASTSTAYNVTVTDTVPTGVVVDPASISGGGTISGANPTTGGGTISWTLPGSIAKNTSAPVLTYNAVLAPSANLTAAGLTNTAKVTGYDSLPAGGRHYTGPTTSATVSPYFPRMTTTKTTPAGNTAYLGESFSWQITARDTGLGAAYQVGTVDTLPANWTYDAGSARVSINGGPASQVEPGLSTAAGVQTLTWTGLGTLAAGTALTISFTATPQPSVTTTPGVGIAVNQTNTASSNAQDATGATGNASGSYTAGPGTAVAHIASADVSLAKAVGTAPTAGGTGSWTVTVHNSGPDTAAGPFTVTDGFNNPAPAGITDITAADTGWSCLTAAPISCSRTVSTDTLASGASFPAITLSYNVSASVVAGTSLANSATVSEHTYDPNPANNTGSANTTVNASADLMLDKALASPQLIAGAPASYSLSVTNAGPANAAGPITVSDPLPAGTTFVSAGGTGWSCDPIAAGTVGATLHCTLPGPLAVGATPPAISVTVGIPAGQTAAVTNTASVSSPTTDPVPANNTDTVTTSPTVRADLSIQKRHLSATFVAGQTADYQIDVHNAGESDAAGVQVVDNLPTGLSYHGFSSTDPNWACAAVGAQLTCSYTGTLRAGTTTSITLTVDLASNFVGPAINTATVSSTTTDPVPGNNSDTDNSSVATLADLSIVKTDSGTTTAGTALTYHLAVHNAGPSDVAGAVTVTDSLPAGLSYASATGTGWLCTYTSATRLISCTLAAGLASGTDAGSITVATTVNSDVGASTITNTAGVASGTTDPVLSNNSSTDPVNVVTSADLSLTKVLSTPAPVIAGTDATFVLSASNAGPSDAVNVSVIDTLPANLSFVSFTGTGWDCVPSGQLVICTRDSIAAHTSAPDITLSTLVSASTPVTLPAGTATLVNNVGIDSTTPGTSTNPAPVDVPVQAKADLSLVKTPKTGTVKAGATYTWNLAVRNDGPSDSASPVTVIDTLPGYQSFVSANAGWDCTASTPPAPPSATDHQTVTCTLSQPLAAGADAPALQLLVQVDSAAPAGDQINQATASSPTPGANGSDSATVTVTRTAQLGLTKVHTGDGVVGQDLAFTLRVHNTGPSVADQVVLSDPLPAGLSYVSATGTGWTCAADPANVVSCTLADSIAAGTDSSDLTLTALVGAQAYPSVTNVAEVSSTDPDLPGTAMASDPVTVGPSALLSLVKKHLGTFAVGKKASYQLTVDNSGATATPGPLVLSDKLPTGLSYVSATGTGWTCAVAASTVTCTHPGALATGGSSSVTLVVTVSAAAYPSVVNTATVSGPGSPSATGTDTAPVTPLVALRISKSLTSYHDNLASYLITVTNDGPNNTVTPIKVSDPLRAGLSFRSAGGAGWSCSAAGSVVSCLHAASLAAGTSSAITLVVAVRATPGTTIGNVATVSGGGSGGTTNQLPSNSAVLSVTAAGGSGSGQLSQTGRNTEDPMLLAVGLLLGGLGLLLLGRRRRTV
ncbi:MAG: beta strand repeat-containing protein, partial [Jatrophihabitans sp.]